MATPRKCVANNALAAIVVQGGQALGLARSVAQLNRVRPNASALVLIPTPNLNGLPRWRLQRALDYIEQNLAGDAWAI